MIRQCEGAYAGQDQVLCDFVGERFDGYEKDVGVTHSIFVNAGLHAVCGCLLLFLRLEAPKADLAVIEGDFILKYC